ncbi:hypothetical protein BU16DRAFT_358575 [Lophium mytilinum]|uniref:Uncharacterized protein n=1 Tax=Lophium mytilinum TaxID=390894 RepID=A0A6A6QTW6_9PEZI|nr:hypothetical protein BU16DRAFT_358575 [Lophium mytilinum]
MTFFAADSLTALQHPSPTAAVHDSTYQLAGAATRCIPLLPPASDDCDSGARPPSRCPRRYKPGTPAALSPRPAQFTASLRPSTLHRRAEGNMWLAVHAVRRTPIDRERAMYGQGPIPNRPGDRPTLTSASASESAGSSVQRLSSGSPCLLKAGAREGFYRSQ